MSTDIIVDCYQFAVPHEYFMAVVCRSNLCAMMCDLVIVNMDICVFHVDAVVLPISILVYLDKT